MPSLYPDGLKAKRILLPPSLWRGLELLGTKDHTSMAHQLRLAVHKHLDQAGVVVMPPANGKGSKRAARKAA